MKIELHETGKSLVKKNGDIRMKQEKRSPSKVLWNPHFLAKFSSFGQKKCDLPYVAKSEFRFFPKEKKESLDFIKLERNFKPTGGRKRESHSSNEMFPSSESFIQI